MGPRAPMCFNAPVKVLFVYGFAPSGHASAARALELRARAAGHETGTLDISSDYHRILGPAINSVYLALIQSFPNLWTTIHDNESAADILSNWRKVYHLFEGQRLRETVDQLKPDRIVCTHAGPFAALTLAKEKNGLPAKLIGVVTDFQPHPYWAVPGADLYVTASEDAARTLAKRGIPEKSLLPAGIPIHPDFERPLNRAQERRKLGFADDDKVVLLTGGSRGLGRLAEAADALLRDLPGAKLVVICGSNQELHARLKGRKVSLYAGVPSETMRALMSAADVMVGKAGGLTSAECLAVGLPMVILDPIAGQEQRNAEFLTAAGAARAADAPAQLPELVRSLLEGGTLDAMRRASRALGRPDAGRRALEAILAP